MSLNIFSQLKNQIREGLQTHDKFSVSMTVVQLLLSAAWVFFQVYIVFHPLVPLVQRPLHVMFALSLVFLFKPVLIKGRIRPVLRGLDFLCAASPLVMGYYFLYHKERLISRMIYIDPVFPLDVVFTILIVILLLEATRRTVGYSLLAVVLAFLLYGWFGNVFPGWLNFDGIDLKYYAEILFLGDGGIFGIPVETSLRYVFYFVLFGAVYATLGGSRLLIEVGIRLTRKQKGGAAKSAIIASSLMGTVSGSAVANVTTTGVFTIPFMVRSGYSKINAAAIEAIASTGGQLVPPIMGIGAFVMAELLGIPYLRIALAGVIPAALFYVSIFFLIDFTARRESTALDAAGKDQPQLSLVSLAHMGIPLAVVIYFIVQRYTPAMAALWGCAAAVLVSFVRRATVLSLSKLIRIIRSAGRQAANVVVPIAAIGIIVAVAIESNLAMKFSSKLMLITGGSIYLSLLFIILGCIILGMGLPTVAAYIMGAVFFVPPLIEFGFQPLSAHFFVFYYSVLAMITPPVALASFTAAGMAEAEVSRTGWRAFVMSMVAFLIPLSFIFRPELLWEGELLHIIEHALYSGVAAIIWAGALAGYIGKRLSVVWRILLGGLAVIVFLPSGPLPTYGALALAALIVVYVAAVKPRLARRRAG